LVTAVPSSLNSEERTPLIYFLVLFPVIVLVLFAWIVIFRPGHLFGPQGFKNEENYVALVASLTAASIQDKEGKIEQAKFDVGKIAETAQVLAPALEATPTYSRNKVLWSTIGLRTILLSAEHLKRSV
jgi:hypothetical protein